MSAAVSETAWTAVCTIDRLWVDRGAAALVNGEQVAPCLAISAATL